MKITDRGPLAGVGRAERTGARPAAQGDRTAAGRKVADSATVLGIPESEFTPHVREAIMALMREVEDLRQELKRAHTRIGDLERLADRDALVPMYNRRAFVRELTRTVAFCERYGAQASLLYFDVNKLKTINDTLGHAAGDAALTQIGEVLVQNVRATDVVARIGGDEFGVILAQADEQRAREKAESLCAAIADRPLDWEGQAVSLGVACGVYGLKPGEDPSHALAAADRDMYAKKGAAKAE